MVSVVLVFGQIIVWCGMVCVLCGIIRCDVVW